MSIHHLAALAASIALVGCAGMAGSSGGHDHASHAKGGGTTATTTAHAAPVDTRQRVDFPEPLRSHTLANMRDHLLVLGEIQRLLAAGAFDGAASLAESRLGMSSLGLHGAHDVARFMPQGMQDAGTAMHRAASRFARAATDASATGDLKAPLDALATVSQTCVACHAAYRLY
jgi:hypothetical protein